MKKPHVLNRSMFNRGGTSAYGRGITSNLVSDEQRQRFNYGGRVKLAYGTPWKDFGWSRDPSLQFQYPDRTRPTSPYNRHKEWLATQAAQGNLTKMGQYAAPYIDVEGDWESQPEKIYDKEGLPIQYGKKISAIGDDYEAQDVYQGSDPRYFERKFKEEDWGEKTDPDIAPDVPVVEEEEEVITKSPMGDEMWNEKIVKDDTDTLDTPDRWAFLDEQQKAKQKLARGYGLTEAAAAAAKWSTAGTAKERSAAISEGLSKVGKIGAKYKGDAEDIKTKAKILGTIEDIKGERKEKQFEKQLEGYYKPIIDIRKEELQLKKDAAALKAEGASNKDVYVALSNAGKLNNPTAKADLLSSFIGKQIQMAANPKEVKQLSTPENDGVIFMDSKGRLWRNTKGDVAVIDIWQDTEFFGE